LVGSLLFLLHAPQGVKTAYFHRLATFSRTLNYLSRSSWSSSTLHVTENGPGKRNEIDCCPFRLLFPSLVEADDRAHC
jgi:hypothetical protein